MSSQVLSYKVFLLRGGRMNYWSKNNPAPLDSPKVLRKLEPTRIRYTIGEILKQMFAHILATLTSRT